MADLIHQRCFNHASREAAARCPECGQFYCRECITEHDDRLICAACLGKLVTPSSVGQRTFAGLTRVVQVAGGVFVLWLFFYLLGQTLLSIDASYHEGTVWKGSLLDSE